MGKITAVFETDDCNCKCNHSEDYIPSAYPECETVDMKLDFFKREIDSIDIDATAEVENDGGDPAVVVTKRGDHLQPTFDFQFQNVIGRQGEQGEDGFSPIISVTDITGGHRVSITDAEGTETFDVMDGQDGQDGQNGQDGQDGQSATIQVGTVTTGAAGSDASVTNSGTSSAAVFNFTIPRGNTGESGQDGNDGFSPVITVTDITGGHRVSITDATGTQTFDVMDGEGRVPAITASASVDANVGTPSVTVTKTGTDATPNFAFAFSNLKGQAGQNGQNGQDGISPTVTVRDITGGHQIEIVSAGGTERFDVMDGVDGTDGSDGISPTVTVRDITGGHQIEIVSAGGTERFDVMDGVDGTDGQDGSDGQAATIQVGTVTTGAAGSSASVTNSGTSSAAVLNFTIPRGDTGAAGQNGQDGVTPVISATATVGSNTGTPSVTVTKSGTDDAPSFAFAFDGLKGEGGAGGVDTYMGSVLIPFNANNAFGVYDIYITPTADRAPYYLQTVKFKASSSANGWQVQSGMLNKTLPYTPSGNDTFHKHIEMALALLANTSSSAIASVGSTSWTFIMPDGTVTTKTTTEIVTLLRAAMTIPVLQNAWAFAIDCAGGIPIVETDIETYLDTIKTSIKPYITYASWMDENYNLLEGFTYGANVPYGYTMTADDHLGYSAALINEVDVPFQCYSE